MYNIVNGVTDFNQKIGNLSQQKRASKAEIRRTLGLLLLPGEVCEVRVVKHRLGTIAGFYDDPDKLAADAWELTEGLASVENRWGKQEPLGNVGSVYVTLNPVKGHKLSLAGMDNRFRVVPARKDRDESGWLTEDQDITDRHLILIDNDPCRGGQEIASTDFGWRNALQRAADIRGFLQDDLGWSSGILASSGNGGHDLFACDLPNDDPSRDLIQSLLHAVAVRFGDNHRYEGKPVPFDESLIDVDGKVFNAGRICTLYGTWKRKGADRIEGTPDNPARPHRLAAIIEAPEALEPVPVELIRRAVDECRTTNTTTVEMPGSNDAQVPHADDDEDLGFGKVDLEDLKTLPADRLKPIHDGFDLHVVLQEINMLDGSPKVSGVFTYYPVKECPFDPDHRRAKLSQHRSGTITYLCPHNSCQGKKEGFERKTTRDYFARYGVVIPENSKKTGDEKPKPEKTSRVALLVRLAQQHCTITKDAATDVVNASFLDLNQRITCPVDSRTFRHWLVRIFREQTGNIVRSSEVSDAVLNLLACYSAYVTTYRRITRLGDVIYIDTLNQGKVVKITANGWQILDDCPDGLVFETRKDMGKLPLPRRGGNLDDLWEFINVRHEDRETYLCFLLASLAGRKPYPILLGNGQEGSAKTTFMNFTVAMIDPCIRANGKDVPDTRRDLVIQARNRHLIAYDNVSRISGDMSDAYCRLSTGAGFTVRGLYKDDEEMVFGGANPVLFNGIPELGDKSDFLSRSIRVRLPKIPPERRKTERYLEARWDERGSTILGTLYDLIANGLRHEASVEEDGKAPRMIDNYQWFRACEMGTGLRLADRFRENYDTLIREVAFETLVGKAVLAFMRDRRLTSLGEMPEERDVWRGTMSALYEGIKPKWLEVCDGSTKQRNLLPGSPARLTNAIDAIASSLVANGIVFIRGRSRDQRWAQIDARGYFQSEVGETDPEMASLSDIEQGMADEVTTPLPAGVTR
jgi:hypothetical protein